MQKQWMPSWAGLARMLAAALGQRTAVSAKSGHEHGLPKKNSRSGPMPLRLLFSVSARKRDYWWVM